MASEKAAQTSGKLMLHAHLENSERYLIAISEVPSISGHSLHKGTPREVFVREFLGEHLPLDLAIGTGELIDYRSTVGEQRNQHDIVIYERSYPRIHLGGGINAFLVESVVATIEVKSVLDPAGVTNAVEAAKNSKQLQSSALGGNRSVANYILAYRGPAKMETAFGWLADAYQHQNLKDPDVPVGNRPSIVSPAVDGIYILGVGACIFENNVGYLNNPLREKDYPNETWTIMNSERGALFMLFAAMLGLFHGGDISEINPYRYMVSFSASELQFARIDSGEYKLVPDKHTAINPPKID